MSQANPKTRFSFLRPFTKQVKQSDSTPPLTQSLLTLKAASVSKETVLNFCDQMAELSAVQKQLTLTMITQSGLYSPEEREKRLKELQETPELTIGVTDRSGIKFIGHTYDLFEHPDFPKDLARLQISTLRHKGTPLVAQNLDVDLHFPAYQKTKTASNKSSKENTPIGLISIAEITPAPTEPQKQGWSFFTEQAVTDRLLCKKHFLLRRILHHKSSLFLLFLLCFAGILPSLSGFDQLLTHHFPKTNFPPILTKAPLLVENILAAFGASFLAPIFQHLARNAYPKIEFAENAPQGRRPKSLLWCLTLSLISMLVLFGA